MARSLRKVAVALTGCGGCLGLCVLVLGLAVAAVVRPHVVPLLWLVPYTSLELGAEVDPAARQALAEVRSCTHARYLVLSAYRDPVKNKAVGGKSDSAHLSGKAFDLAVPHHLRAELYDCAEAAGFRGYGWGNRSVHIDTSGRRWWTYDDAGEALSGNAKHAHLHKAPDNFRADWGLD